MGLIRYVMYDLSNLTIGHLTGLKAVIDNNIPLEPVDNKSNKK